MQVVLMTKRLKEVVEGCGCKNMVNWKVSDVVDENLLTEAVAQIPIFNRIRELDKRDMMAVYECLERNQ